MGDLASQHTAHMAMSVPSVLVLLCATPALAFQASAFHLRNSLRSPVSGSPQRTAAVTFRPQSQAAQITAGLFGSSKITEQEVEECQANWANAIRTISKTYAQGGDYVSAAAEAAGELYGYGHSNVLFKPTKAAARPFRPTPEDAMSYFVGAKAVDNGIPEDAGFAINGGKGWSDVVFDNHQIELNGKTAIAMGTYYFTCATTGTVSKVEYTFGYKRNKDGKARIFLHHSSVPYSAAPAAEGPPVTEAEVLEVQKKWANAIKTISKTHKDGGDYIQAAADAAGELYAYGHSNVLFKPTKAAEYPFRPTPEEAMSYFVGGSVVDGGYDEDGGFAINGGKGWADCVYKNHQVQVKGGQGLAMGTYDFTCATTGDVSTVEYTFGYTRCADGKVRIFLHHSSVPYGSGPAPVPAPVAAPQSEVEQVLLRAIKEKEELLAATIREKDTANKLVSTLDQLKDSRADIDSFEF